MHGAKCLSFYIFGTSSLMREGGEWDIKKNLPSIQTACFKLGVGQGDGR